MCAESLAPVLNISKHNESDIYYVKLDCALTGIKGTIKAGNELISIYSKLIGEFNAER
mgnify:CR=1 FL=1